MIPRKNARDLRTIRQKLDADKYDTVEAFEADLDLMIDNALLFNGVVSEVGAIAVEVRSRYKEMLATHTTAKRKGGEKSNTQPAKKVKLV